MHDEHMVGLGRVQQAMFGHGFEAAVGERSWTVLVGLEGSWCMHLASGGVAAQHVTGTVGSPCCSVGERKLRWRRRSRIRFLPRTAGKASPCIGVVLYSQRRCHARKQYRPGRRAEECLGICKCTIRSDATDGRVEAVFRHLVTRLLKECSCEVAGLYRRVQASSRKAEKCLVSLSLASR